MTPVEKYKGILLKRCDKFIIGDVNGGKVIQAETLIINNLNIIKEKHNNSIICYCSIKSPQSAIISTICKKYGIECNIITYKTIEPNINLSIAQKNGAKIYGVKVAYDAVHKSYAKKYFPDSFLINMGFVDGTVIESIIDEVQNIPDELDYLVVAVGSAMNFIGILKGLKKYDKRVKKIVGVYVGRKPFDTIKKYYDGDIKYDIVKYRKPYSTSININNYFFDPIYEAKAYDWLMMNVDISKSKCLLWVIGKRNMDEKNIEEINYFRLKC